MRRECGLSSAYGGKQQFKLPLAKHTAPPITNVTQSVGCWPMRTITLKGVTAGENRREGPTKRLSDAEFQSRREKGLCFRCEEKYHVGHRCKAKEQKELRTIVVKENREELEIVEEDYYEAEAEFKNTEVENVKNLNIELSLNSVVGLTSLGIMKVRGKINGVDVIFLIDCGVTHNFISDKLVNSLNFPTKETSNYGVILGSDTAVKGKGIYGRVDVLLGEWKIIDSFLPLELGGVDVLLCMQ